MNRLTRISILGALGSLSMVVYSLIPKKFNPALSMYPCDWPTGDEALKPRRYRSFRHAMHHFKELMDLNLYIFDVYALRGLPARFRESIMLRTALVNDCLG